MCVIREFMWKGVFIHRKSQNSIRAQTNKKRSVKNPNKYQVLYGEARMH